MTLTYIPLHSLNIPVHSLQVSREVRVTSEVKEAGEGPHLEPPAIVVKTLEPKLPPVFYKLLQDWVKCVGVVVMGQL